MDSPISMKSSGTKSGAEYKSIKSDSHRGLSDVKDAKAKQAVHVNDDRENDAVALDMQEK